MTSVSTTVVAGLAAAVAAQQLEFDPAQNAVAARLDALAAVLRSRARPRGLLARLAAGARAGGARDAPRGIYLWGGVGRGKTHLLDLFYASLDLPQRERTHYYRFMQSVHAELRAARRRSDPLEIVAASFAARARVLCLDEFFVSDIADAMLLSGLLAGLIRRGVVLVATSNLPPHELYAGGLQRERFLPAVALLERHLDVLHLDGAADYRLRRLESAHTYWDCARPGTAAELRRLFDALTHGAAAGPTDVVIAGRSIAAVAAGPGTAWFEFAALCAGARSAEDYIELAHLYQTLILADVPVMTAADDDAARRFVTLIDELYDRGVKLVVSAAAPPGELYRGERLRFEFARAASRLVEMQSQTYLSRQHRA